MSVFSMAYVVVDARDRVENDMPTSTSRKLQSVRLKKKKSAHTANVPRCVICFNNFSCKPLTRSAAHFPTHSLGSNAL